ncbi:hypothetical protein TVAG_094240 [Trichomonas vaginalis G3]|uniref:Protein kinase domain-containing protein n=1 Tax=Trichomonas vaginalis (strain ATCC PRA-98 / G3) TaxID=412133 RepID=A2DBP6_TRIV3|nr:protein kinase-like (PK-like) family [Trichomonas vaginalis G3]EAY22249.1 hypothetical protein TVAG_094240 [Trichomonas vaginalis G3]KAI5533280.1 protein kinase-like (PK-like) family [Trichomonas vaginalis G3]|eukprot:XP_001583235.1 hypothetical protein [Trichomonas vaginalis G3]
MASLADLEPINNKTAIDDLTKAMDDVNLQGKSFCFEKSEDRKLKRIFEILEVSSANLGEFNHWDVTCWGIFRLNDPFFNKKSIEFYQISDFENKKENGNFVLLIVRKKFVCQKLENPEDINLWDLLFDLTYYLFLMHKRGFIFRHIPFDTICRAKINNKDLYIIDDFQYVRVDNSDKKTAISGSTSAPELSSADYNYKVDIFELGKILLEAESILKNGEKFNIESFDIKQLHNKAAEYFTEGDELGDIIKQCLDKDPNNRPTDIDILNQCKVFEQYQDRYNYVMTLAHENFNKTNRRISHDQIMDLYTDEEEDDEKNVVTSALKGFHSLWFGINEDRDRFEALIGILDIEINLADIEFFVDSNDLSGIPTFFCPKKQTSEDLHPDDYPILKITYQNDLQKLYLKDFLQAFFYDYLSNLNYEEQNGNNEEENGNYEEEIDENCCGNEEKVDENGCGNDENGCGIDENGCGNEENGCGNEENGCGNEENANRSDKVESQNDEYTKEQYREMALEKYKEIMKNRNHDFYYDAMLRYYYLTDNKLMASLLMHRNVSVRERLLGKSE